MVMLTSIQLFARLTVDFNELHVNRMDITLEYDTGPIF